MSKDRKSRQPIPVEYKGKVYRSLVELALDNKYQAQYYGRQLKRGNSEIKKISPEEYERRTGQSFLRKGGHRTIGHDPRELDLNKVINKLWSVPVKSLNDNK